MQDDKRLPEATELYLARLQAVRQLRDVTKEIYDNGATVAVAPLIAMLNRRQLEFQRVADLNEQVNKFEETCAAHLTVKETISVSGSNLEKVILETKDFIHEILEMDQKISRMLTLKIEQASHKLQGLASLRKLAASFKPPVGGTQFLNEKV